MYLESRGFDDFLLILGLVYFSLNFLGGINFYYFVLKCGVFNELDENVEVLKVVVIGVRR